MLKSPVASRLFSSLLAVFVIEAGFCKPASADDQTTEEATPTEPALPQGTLALMDEFPGIQPYVVDGRVSAVFGRAMTSGFDAYDAEQMFWTYFGDAFGPSGIELTQTRASDSTDGGVNSGLTACQ